MILEANKKYNMFDKELTFESFFHRVGCKKDSIGKMVSVRFLDLDKKHPPRKDLHQHLYAAALDENRSKWFVKFLTEGHYRKSKNVYDSLKSFDKDNVVLETFYDSVNNALCQPKLPKTLHEGIKNITLQQASENADIIVSFIERIYKSEDEDAKKNISHFDMSYGNFMFDSKKRIAIIDFGLWPRDTTIQHWYELAEKIRGMANDL